MGQLVGIQGLMAIRHFMQGATLVDEYIIKKRATEVSRTSGSRYEAFIENHFQQRRRHFSLKIAFRYSFFTDDVIFKSQQKFTKLLYAVGTGWPSRWTQCVRSIPNRTSKTSDAFKKASHGTHTIVEH